MPLHFGLPEANQVEQNHFNVNTSPRLNVGGGFNGAAGKYSMKKLTQPGRHSPRYRGDKS